MTSRAPLSFHVSSVLDAIRAFAACYVVAHHLSQQYKFQGLLKLSFGFGQEAVILFFLLSGFVIYANEHSRVQRSYRSYYLRRIARIYPTLIVALVVSTFIAIDNGTFIKEFSFKSLLGTLVGLQDVSSLKPGVIVNSYLGNTPLWSLSYELAFYAAFPIVLWAWKLRAAFIDHVIGVFCCASYIFYIFLPNHFSLVAAYFLVWWGGAMTAHAFMRSKNILIDAAPAFFWLLILSTISGIVVVVFGYRNFGVYPYLMFRHFLAALIFMLAFANFSRINAFSRIFVFCKYLIPVASISYGLYVLHYPILVSWHRAGSLVGFSIACVILVIISFWADRKLSRYMRRWLLPEARDLLSAAGQLERDRQVTS